LGATQSGFSNVRKRPQAKRQARQPQRKAGTESILSPRTAALKRYLDAKAGVTINALSPPRASSPNVLLYKVMGKMFAVLTIRGAEYVMLKCDPHLAEMLRGQYAGIGHRTHLDRRHWIAVSLDADVPPKEVKRLAAHSYDLVCAGLTRKQKAALAELAG
jgi:predicted DNA-binding protein (MmcQ/YjbR family)